MYEKHYKLTEDEWRRFKKALDNPSEPNEELLTLCENVDNAFKENQYVIMLKRNDTSQWFNAFDLPHSSKDSAESTIRRMMTPGWSYRIVRTVTVEEVVV